MEIVSKKSIENHSLKDITLSKENSSKSIKSGKKIALTCIDNLSKQ